MLEPPRTCHFHRTVGYLENGCRKIWISSRMMMVMRRMMMMLMMMMVMMKRHCEGAAAWRDSPGIWREFPLRGGRGEGGSLSPGCSGIRGPARPFASQSKTQGSPLGGYLSWSEPAVSCVRPHCWEHHVAVPLSWQRSPPRIGRSLWHACNNFRRLTILEVNSLIEPWSSQFNTKSTRVTDKFGA